jgi:uncharacterized membrane protein (UPF0127 family)
MLRNASTDATLASRVEVAQTSAERRRGLLGRDGLADGSAMVITRCNAVHTIGMRFPIDVAFIDAQGRVRKVVEDLAPWRMAMSLPATTVIEFPAGALKDGALLPGDTVHLSGVSLAKVAPRWASVSSQNSATRA